MGHARPDRLWYFKLLARLLSWRLSRRFLQGHLTDAKAQLWVVRVGGATGNSDTGTKYTYTARAGTTYTQPPGPYNAAHDRNTHGEQHVSFQKATWTEKDDFQAISDTILVADHDDTFVVHRVDGQGHPRVERWSRLRRCSCGSSRLQADRYSLHIKKIGFRAWVSGIKVWV